MEAGGWRAEGAGPGVEARGRRVVAKDCMQEAGVQTWRPKDGGWQLEARSWRPETGKKKLEARVRRPEARGPWSEAGGRRHEA